MNRDLKNATRSTRDMDEYLEVRSSQEIIDDIKAAAGQETLRDQFATQALAGLCANPGGPFQANAQSGWTIVNCTPADVARQCYDLADAMLAERAVAVPSTHQNTAAK